MLQELKEARRAGAQTLAEADDIIGQPQAQPPTANGHAAAFSVPIPALTPLHGPAASLLAPAAMSHRSTGRLTGSADLSFGTPLGVPAALQASQTHNGMPNESAARP